MTAAAPSGHFAIPLDSLEVGTGARIVSIDWATLEEAEACRLRQFGFDEGVAIEALHLGPFGRDPLAVRVGHARAVHVLPVAA